MKNISHPSLIRRAARSFYALLAPASTAKVERAEWIYYIKFLREGMIVFDVGANIGELSLLFSHFVGASGQVHAFEPIQETFGRLQSIVTAAGCSNVRLNQAAVTDKNGLVAMHVYASEYASWNTLADRSLERYGINIQPPTLQEVVATTVDAYCTENMIDHIDLLKIDVEGAEYQVLSGAQRMLENKKIRRCVFEFGQTTYDMGNTPKMILDYLNKVNYRVQNVVARDPLFPHEPRTKEPYFSLMVAKPQ
jgi:FkbM family methyltransferase